MSVNWYVSSFFNGQAEETPTHNPRYVTIKALFEILLLSGGTPDADFKDLAHAWGREKGFHTVLACSICERRGEVQRKKRKDAGIKHQVNDNRINPAAQREREAQAMAAVPATLPNKADEPQEMVTQSNTLTTPPSQLEQI